MNRHRYIQGEDRKTGRETVKERIDTLAEIQSRRG
jgi:hypothetical protein